MASRPGWTPPPEPVDAATMVLGELYFPADEVEHGSVVRELADRGYRLAEVPGIAGAAYVVTIAPA